MNEQIAKIINKRKEERQYVQRSGFWKEERNT